MDRRLLQSLAAAGMISQAAPPALAQSQEPDRKTRLDRMDYFYYRQGSEGARINQLLSSQMPC